MVDFNWENMKKPIIITILLIILIAVLAYIGNAKYNEQLDRQLEVSGIEPVCPICPLIVITAKSIKANAVDYSGKKFEGMTKIKLPESVSEIQIGDKIYTKKELEAIK